ncbi:hypothetical protein WA158_008484 [Blastocystis sp. Blastoise]
MDKVNNYLGSTSFTSLLVRCIPIYQNPDLFRNREGFFNFKATEIFVNSGYTSFIKWFKDTVWYPHGVILNENIYPGLAIFTGTLYNVLHFLHIPVSLHTVCIYLEPVLSTLVIVALYTFSFCLLTQTSTYIHDKNPKSLIFSPSFIQLASFLSCFFYFFSPLLLANSSGCIYTTDSLTYFLSLVTLSFYIYQQDYPVINTVISAISLVTLSYISTFSFIILDSICFYSIYKMKRYGGQTAIQYYMFYVLYTTGICFMFGFNTWSTKINVVIATYTVIYAYYFSLSSPSISLRITMGILFLGLLSIFLYQNSSLVSLLSYHSIYTSMYIYQPTSWSSLYKDMGLLMFIYIISVYLILKHMNSLIPMFILYISLGLLVFSTVINVMTPYFILFACIVSAIGTTYYILKQLNIMKNIEEHNKKIDYIYIDNQHQISNTNVIVTIAMCILLILISLQNRDLYSHSPAIIKGRTRDINDFKEAQDYLSTLPRNTTLYTWKDNLYLTTNNNNIHTPYDTSSLNLTSYTDLAGILINNEYKAYDILKKYNVQYVSVIFGGKIGYRNDDMNRIVWLARIHSHGKPTLSEKLKNITNSLSQQTKSAIPKDIPIKVEKQEKQNSIPDSIPVEVPRESDKSSSFENTVDIEYDNNINNEDNNNMNNEDNNNIHSDSISSDTSSSSPDIQPVNIQVIPEVNRIVSKKPSIPAGNDGDDIDLAALMQEEINEYMFVDKENRIVIDRTASIYMRESLLYKLSYYNYNHEFTTQKEIQGYDIVRRQSMKNYIKLTHFKEVFTSSNWIVRIYELQDDNNDTVVDTSN